MRKVIFGVLVLSLAGCQSMGFKKGYLAYRENHIEDKDAWVPAYSYGFLLGWQAAEKEIGYKKEKVERKIKQKSPWSSYDRMPNFPSEDSEIKANEIEN